MTVKVEVTKAAQDQVRQLIQGQKPGTAVRVFVQAGGGGGGGGCCGEGGGGGCGCGSGGGATYGLAFDRARNGDEVVPVDGFSVVVDTMSAELVNGAKIDFVEGLDASGFTIVPANAPAPKPGAEAGGGCGCGSGGCGSC
ncbi:MAG TPA: iron-sulfur cluster assembly accessory protein [Thermoplasmata archaeon]|nr:iron-sulfur cluster assembly accessory protein [Thermoplasmata archaeon]